jgi:predicted secreted protein
MTHIVTLLCACLLFLTCSQTPPNRVLTLQDHGTLLKCRAQQEFAVELEANPSTGYTWHVIKGDSHYVRLLREETIPSSEKRPGAPGKQFFYFQTLTKGRTPLLLEYRRSWEKDAPPANAFSITLVIQK